MSAEDLDTATPAAEAARKLEAQIAKEPERPKNGQMTNRMLRNLRDPSYVDPVTKAAAQAAKGARK